LWVTLGYSIDVQDAKTTAERAAELIERKLKLKFCDDGTWKSLELRQCVARAETEFTYRDALRQKQYRLDYLSLRPSPPVPTANL